MEKSYKVRTSEGNFKTIRTITPLHAARLYLESTGLLDNAYTDESDLIEVEGYRTYSATYEPFNDVFELVEN